MGFSSHWFSDERGIPRGKSHTAGGRGGRFRFQRPEPATCGSVASGDLYMQPGSPRLSSSLLSSAFRFGCMISGSLCGGISRVSDDQALIQIVDAALADTTRRSGALAGLPPGMHPVLHWSVSHQSTRRRSIAPRTQRTGIQRASTSRGGSRARPRLRLRVSPQIFPAIH